MKNVQCIHKYIIHNSIIIDMKFYEKLEQSCVRMHSLVVLSFSFGILMTFKYHQVQQHNDD